MSKLSSGKNLLRILKRTPNALSGFCKYFSRQRRCPTKSSGVELEPDGGHLIYKRLFLFFALPVIFGTAAMVNLHKKNCPFERPPFVKYEYMRRITKRYPWGDGVRSLFHNPKVNPLPDGYEELGQENCDK